MVEAVRAGAGKIIPLPLLEKRVGRQSWISENIGGVSSGQLQKFLSLIPGDVAEKEEFWEGFRIWSCYSALWDDHEPDWLELDDWRGEMGLERLNPVRLIGPHGKLLIFKRLINRCAPPETPPEGYRFGNPGDLKKVAGGIIPKEKGLVVCLVSGEWNFVNTISGPETTDIELRSFAYVGIDPRTFFCYNTVYVPLVEL
jgi:hypothetical protein